MEPEMTFKDNPIQQLSQLTGGLAHEIRNPLSTLNVNLQLLAEDLRDLDDATDNVRRSVLRIETMQNEVNRLRDILDGFIHFVAHHQLNLKTVDINKILADLIEFYEPQAASEGIRLMTSLSSEPLICIIDVDLIKQAWFNLFINAQQAMPEGGDLMVRTQAADGQARIDVADTGEGIGDEDVGRVFDAYFSTKKGGSGLGLAMTHRIISEHGGRISVESQEGEGSLFSITLPLCKEDGCS